MVLGIYLSMLKTFQNCNSSKIHYIICDSTWKIATFNLQLILNDNISKRNTANLLTELYGEEFQLQHYFSKR